MINLLIGHSSFYLRSGWIKKGVEYVQKNSDEKIFVKSNIEAIDELGIGSVMIQSLKFWLTMLDVLKKEKNDYILKREIEYIVEKDPYFQKKNTLWLLHSYIMDRDDKVEKPVLWDLLIGDEKNNMFSEEEAREILYKYYKEQNLTISERSIKDSVNVFLKNYYNDITGKEDPEDNMFSPFIRLDYLVKNEEKKYYFRNVESDEIAEEIVFLILKRKIGMGQITISNSYNYINRMIKMKIGEYEKLLSKLENRKLISIDRAGGLENINILKDISEKEIIQLIMERE